MSLKIGDSVSTQKKITAEGIRSFANLSGDMNPVHLDSQYAQKTIFKEVIAHGLYTASFISALIANELPGPGSIYLGQELKFLKPAYVGDELRIEVSVLDIPKPSIVKLSTQVHNQKNEMLINGIATVKIL